MIHVSALSFTEKALPSQAAPAAEKPVQVVSLRPSSVLLSGKSHRVDTMKFVGWDGIQAYDFTQTLPAEDSDNSASPGFIRCAQICD
jgi:hypothetical protein